MEIQPSTFVRWLNFASLKTVSQFHKVATLWVETRVCNICRVDTHEMKERGEETAELQHKQKEEAEVLQLSAPICDLHREQEALCMISIIHEYF